jgi:cell division ATPase FtsA
VPTTQLKGALCYYFISEEFAALAETVLKDLGVQTVRFMPSTLAQSLYLLPEKRREGYAFLLDIGFMTTSVSVVYGNGIVHEETFDFGKGTLLVSLMQNLSVDMETAEEILRSSNVSGGVVPRDLTWTSERGDASFPVQFINDVLKCELDVLCESVENFLTKHYREKTATIFAVNPISITGEGSTCVAGVAEHIANRLNRLTEVVYPDLPYYDKPTCSSRIGLLNMAISDRKKRGWFQRFFSKNGGKNK